MKITEAIILLCEQLKEWKEYTENDYIIIANWEIIDIEYFMLKWLAREIIAPLYFLNKDSMSNYYLSKCCNAQVTDHRNSSIPYLCQKCNNPCDIYPVIDKN